MGPTLDVCRSPRTLEWDTGHHTRVDNDFRIRRACQNRATDRRHPAVAQASRTRFKTACATARPGSPCCIVHRLQPQAPSVPEPSAASFARSAGRGVTNRPRHCVRVSVPHTHLGQETLPLPLWCFRRACRSLILRSPSLEYAAPGGECWITAPLPPPRVSGKVLESIGFLSSRTRRSHKLSYFPTSLETY